MSTVLPTCWTYSLRLHPNHVRLPLKARSMLLAEALAARKDAIAEVDANTPGVAIPGPVPEVRPSATELQPANPKPAGVGWRSDP